MAERCAGIELYGEHVNNAESETGLSFDYSASQETVRAEGKLSRECP